METYSLRLLEIVEEGPDVRTFRFEEKRGGLYKPGQYLILTLSVSGKETPKAFSISSSPTERGFIQFTKKVTDSAFSKTLCQLKVGDVCDVRYPMGAFTFEGEHPKVAFLSGGIGITPLRSICKNATDRQLASDIVLLYSSRTPEYLIFRHDFDEMARVNRNLKVIYTLTDCTEPIEGCRRGHIDDPMVAREIPDYAQRVFYICGPPGMVDAMRSMLQDKLALPADKVVTENFVGY